MNKKILLVVIFLSAAMLISPLLGTVAACNAERSNDDRRDDKYQTFGVTGSFSFLDILKGDHQYFPSSDNVKKRVDKLRGKVHR